MGTSNFHQKNASKIYSVETSYYDEELEEYVQDDLIWEDTRLNVSTALENLAKAKGRKYVEDDRIEISGELRSFPSTSIGSYFDSFDFHDIIFEVELIAHTTSGYYEGFNLDYEFIFRTDDMYEDHNNLRDFIDDYKTYGNISDEIYDNIDKLEELFENKVKELTEELESVFEKFSVPLREIGGFSDGTSIYEKDEPKEIDDGFSDM